MSEDSKPESNVEIADSPGTVLRQARERYGLSEEDVADELNLSVSQIRALEDNRFEDLPGKTYVQGYLKSYARLLNCDEDHILQNFDQQEDALSSGIRPVMRETRSTDSHMKLVSLGMMLVLGGLMFTWWQSREQSTVVPLEVTEELHQQSGARPGSLAAIHAEGHQFGAGPVMGGQSNGLESAGEVGMTGQDIGIADVDLGGADASAAAVEVGTELSQGDTPAGVEAMTEGSTAQTELGGDGPDQVEADSTSNGTTSQSESVTEPEAQFQVAQQVQAQDSSLEEADPTQAVTVDAPEKNKMEVASVREAVPAQAPLQNGESDPGVEAAALNVKPGYEVTLKFSSTSWVDLRDANGQRLLYENVNKGREIAVQGTPPFSVFLGNADGVEIDYGGEPFDFSAFTNGIYARFELGAEQLNQP